MNVCAKWRCGEILGSFPITGRHVTLELSTIVSIATITSLLYPYPALISMDNPNSVSSLEITLKHLSTALIIAVLMQKPFLV
jgi:hypothetical protein